MADVQTSLEGGAKPTDWTKIEPLGGGANPNGMYNIKNNQETFKKVLCNDGTTQNVGSNPLGGRVDMPCKNNGGRAENQSIVKELQTKEVYSQDSEDKFWRSLGFTQSDMIKPKHKGRFYLVVVLVAGYFAYKKFKK